MDNGIIIVAAAALVGGRLYHVIDQWQLYKDNLDPDRPAALHRPGRLRRDPHRDASRRSYITRRWHQSFWKWADVIAPGLFVMQAIGRWGNFFNQELYGPPTNLPWGIAIDCAHRSATTVPAQWPCSDYPVATTGFHPLFLYESVSAASSARSRCCGSRAGTGPRMRPGDLLLIFFMWYAVVRFWLETLRDGELDVLRDPDGDARLGGRHRRVAAVLLLRHRPGAAGGDRWGEPPAPEDELVRGRRRGASTRTRGRGR